MIEKKKISDLENVKQFLIKSLNNENMVIRLVIIRTMEILGDSSMIPILELIAQNDPFCTKDGNRFVVRERAKDAIQVIQNKLKENQK